MSFEYLISAELTDIGRKRKKNEDSLLRVPELGVFCVADGMGGVVGGDVASQAVVQTLQEDLKQFLSGPASSFAKHIEVTKQALNKASLWIKNRAEELGISGTGTTAVVMVFDPQQPSRALVLHAGDSRAYRYRKGKLTQLTQDHSVAAIAGLSNEQVLPSIFRGVVTRAVGLEREVALDQTAVEVEPSDLFLICSDGLTKMVPDALLEKIIHDHEQIPLEALARKLVNQANDVGGMDNISVILIRTAGKLPEDLSFDEEGDRDTDMLTPATHNTSATIPMIHANDQKTAETKTMEESPTAEKCVPASRRKRFLLFLLGFVALGAFGVLIYSKSPSRGEPSSALAIEEKQNPAPVVLSSVEKEQIQQKIRATLSDGDWGALQAVVDPVLSQLAELPEVTMYRQWLSEWQRIEQGARAPENIFKEFQDPASVYFQRLGKEGTSPQIDWAGAPGNAATVFCAQKYSLQTQLLNDVGFFCDEHLKDVIAMESGVVSTLEWLQTYSAKRHYKIRELLQTIGAHIANVELWLEKAQLDCLPLQLEQLDDGMLAELDRIAQTEDELWTILYETIRYLNMQVAGWDEIEDVTTQQRVQNLGALRVRIINIRAQYKDNVREWRLREGKEDILKFIQLVNETFPQTI